MDLSSSIPFGRLVQVVDGLYYDGYGNLLNIAAGMTFSGTSGTSGSSGSGGSGSGTSGTSGEAGPPGPIGGDDTQVIYNSAGSAVGSDNLIFDGSKLTGYNISVTNEFDLNGQIFYSHGDNGFSVNENFDAGNTSTTAYHFTSGDSSRDVIFSVAKTGNFTNLFGVYGSVYANSFVIGSETPNNTTFEFRSGVGINGALNLAGGTLLYKIGNDGQIYAPLLQESTKSNILYYDTITGLVTYGEGSSGTSGTSGSSGSSGSSGTSGSSGSSGSSGTSGVGTPGTPGTSGTSGTSASGGGSSFTYAYTLFVDPNGDDVTALEGRLDLPWQTIGAALGYLETNNLRDYTIWVFPGIYDETKEWNFKYSDNTTVKLNGGVKVVFNLKNTSNYLIGGASNFSIVGDDRENYGDGLPNALLTYNKDSHIIAESFFLITEKGISIRISNVSIYGDPYRYGFILANTDDTRLHLINTFVRSQRNNIILIDGASLTKIAVTNSILVSGVIGDIQYANIKVDINFGSDPEIRFFNGIWNFENVRFISYGDTEIGTERGHILSNTLGAAEAMYVTLSNCKFYMNQSRGVDIWYDIAESGINVIEVVGTSIANSGHDYSSPGSGLHYLGEPTFIVVDQGIIDPIDIMI